AAPPLLGGEIPRMLWVTPWVHDGEGGRLLSVHLVNYDVDFESAQATPAEAFTLSVRLPEGLQAEEAMLLAPGEEARPLVMRVEGGVASIEVPSVRIYGCIAIGPRGLERARSDRLQGDAMIARARFALDGNLGQFEAPAEELAGLREGDPAAYREGAEQLLQNVAAAEDQRLVDEWQAMADTEGAVMALDFGAEEDAGQWQALSADMAYDAGRGYGWLPLADGSQPTPEETGYAQAHRSPSALDKIEAHPLPFWPYPTQPPAEIMRRALYSGQQRTLQVDLPDGIYQVRVVTGNPSWTMRSYRCSGMVSAGGGVRLFDTPYYPGGAANRSFATTVTGGHLDLTFGGPSGWGASAVVITNADADPGDALAVAALREWRVSPRYPNPDWWPVRQVRFGPDDDLAAPNAAAWTPVTADGGGVVDLGDNTQAETGDVVYAMATIEADAAGPMWLNLGTSSSAVAYLNGEQVAYLPNVKGLQRDECPVQVQLRAGRNVLVLKLERYWERHWMFYASGGVG
ncbi:MAG TPA: hypothetical protein VM283_04105, partial [Armatimonadota bacterium]|nr:hypothetical protein [Armatimonadota bacterium]